MLDSQQRLCTDVQVMGGANCWTNDQMVRVNVCVDLALSGSNKEKRSIPFAVHELCNKAKADAYCKCLSDYLKKTTQSRQQRVVKEAVQAPKEKCILQVASGREKATDNCRLCSTRVSV